MSVIVTTASLVVVAFVSGLWFGSRTAHDPLSGVIDAVAAKHVARFGGAATACMGWVGTAPDWLEVRCGDQLYRVHLRTRRVELLGPHT